VARFAIYSLPRFVPGLVARYQRGRFSILADPHIAFGLANRDRGNENTLAVPLWWRTRIVGPVTTILRTGLRGGISGFGDKWSVPVGLGAGLTLPMGWQAELLFSLPKLVGPLNSPRPRHLLLWLSYRVR